MIHQTELHPAGVINQTSNDSNDPLLLGPTTQNSIQF